MRAEELAEQILATWRRHHEILLLLLQEVPSAGLTVIPPFSRGRMVAEQFAHLDAVRRGWLYYHDTGLRPRRPRVEKGKPPSRAQLKKSLQASGRAVEAFLARALRGEVRPRMFGRDPVRFLGYLLAHESHHRGQMVLALKQTGHKLPERVAMQGLWGTWFYGR